MAETVQSYPGLYPLGSGLVVALPSGTSLFSNGLNTRDVYTPGASDFVLLGPGSQVWIVGYAVSVSTPPPFLAPATPLGLRLRVLGSFGVTAPFVFGPGESLILPVYEGVHQYSGRARVESPVVELELENGTGSDLEVSFQFWGKAL